MANEEHRAVLRQGVEAWNAWRREHPDIRPDLSEASLSGANLHGADLSEANLDRAILRGTELSEAHLDGAQLRGANLTWANLREADLRGADLDRADLQRAVLVRTKLANANLTGCRIYGMAAWDLHLEGATQANLIITPGDQPEITVDALEYWIRSPSSILICLPAR